MSSTDELLGALRVIADVFPNTNQIQEILNLTKTFYSEPNEFRRKIFNSSDYKGRNHLIRTVRSGNVPWARKVLELLNTNEQYEITSDQFMGKECYVCYEAFAENEIVYRVPCRGKHIFHKECITRWIKVNSSCPYCRDSIVIEDIHGFLNRTSDTDKSVLYYAIKLGNLPFVEELIEKGALVHYNDASPLHLAAGFSHQQMVDYFLSKGMDLESKDRFGHTPLYYAASYGSEEVLYHLLGKGADYKFHFYDEHADRAEDTTMLHVAVEKHNIWGIEPSIKHFQSKGISIDTRDSNQNTPLLLAIKHHWWDIVDELIKKGASVDSFECNFGNPLWCSMEDKNDTEESYDEGFRIFCLLLDTMDSLFLHKEKHQEYLAFLSKTLEIGCVMKLRFDMVRKLLDTYDVEVNKKCYPYLAKLSDSCLMSAKSLNTFLYEPDFFFACVNEQNIELLKHYIIGKIDINVKDKDGNTAAHLSKSQRILGLLAEHNFDFTARNNKGQTVLHTSFNTYDLSGDLFTYAGGQLSIVRKSEQNPPPTLPQLVDTDEEDLPPVPVPKKKVVVGKLIRNLYLFKENLQFLLEHGVDINAVDNLGLTPLQIALAKQEKQSVELLLAKGADPNKCVAYKKPIEIILDLHIHDKKEYITLLLKNGADARAFYKGTTLMHYAITNVHWDLIDLLIEKGLSCNVRDEKEFTPLYCLLQDFTHWTNEKIKKLIEKGLDVNCPVHTFPTGKPNYALHTVVEKGRLNLTKILVENGANIDILDINGKSALHYATKDLKSGILVYLIEKRCNRELRDLTGKLALEYVRNMEVEEEYQVVEADDLDEERDADDMECGWADCWVHTDREEEEIEEMEVEMDFNE